MTRFLVTGAAGFIGYHLASALSKRPGAEVIVVDNFIRGECDTHYLSLCEQPNVHRLDLDLAASDCVKDLPDNVDVVLHLAALNGTDNFYERPFEVVRSCSLSTLHLLERYCSTALAGRFVFASTSEAYAACVSRFGWPVPTNEDVPLVIDDVFNPRWSYAASKILGEVAVINACRSARVPFTIIRYHNTYGPRMGDKHVVPDFLERIQRGQFLLYGATDTRAFIYIEDAVRATILVSLHPDAKGDVINIGSEKEITIRDLANTLMNLSGIKGELVIKPSPVGSVPRRAPDISKLKRKFGYSEKWSLEAGLTETIKYYLPEALEGSRSECRVNQ